MGKVPSAFFAYLKLFHLIYSLTMSSTVTLVTSDNKVFEVPHHIVSMMKAVKQPKRLTNCVKLLSKDDIEFPVPYEVVLMLRTVRTMLE